VAAFAHTIGVDSSGAQTTASLKGLQRAGSAKSVFNFDVQGSVAKSTRAGIPWLRFIRQRLGSGFISGPSTASQPTG
jgi:hypothetical protein